MDSLKPVLSQYLEVSKRLADVNERAGELRDERRTLELDLAAAYNEAPLPDKIELKTSMMVFQVKKPGEWKKGWTLSKKQLQEYSARHPARARGRCHARDCASSRAETDGHGLCV
jgi:hypothetical protein